MNRIKTYQKLLTLFWTFLSLNTFADPDPDSIRIAQRVSAAMEEFYIIEAQNEWNDANGLSENNVYIFGLGDYLENPEDYEFLIFSGSSKALLKEFRLLSDATIKEINDALKYYNENLENGYQIWVYCSGLKVPKMSVELENAKKITREKSQDKESHKDMRERLREATQGEFSLDEAEIFEQKVWSAMGEEITNLDPKKFVYYQTNYIGLRRGEGYKAQTFYRTFYAIRYSKEEVDFEKDAYVKLVLSKHKNYSSVLYSHVERDILAHTESMFEWIQAGGEYEYEYIEPRYFSPKSLCSDVELPSDLIKDKLSQSLDDEDLEGKNAATLTTNIVELNNYLLEKLSEKSIAVLFSDMDGGGPDVKCWDILATLLVNEKIYSIEDLHRRGFKFYEYTEEDEFYIGYDIILANYDPWEGVPEGYNRFTYDYTSFEIPSFENNEEVLLEQLDIFEDFFTYVIANSEEKILKDDAVVELYNNLNYYRAHPEIATQGMSYATVRAELLSYYKLLGAYKKYSYSLKDLAMRKRLRDIDAGGRLLGAVYQYEKAGTAIPLNREDSYDQYLARYGTNSSYFLLQEFRGVYEVIESLSGLRTMRILTLQKSARKMFKSNGFKSLIASGKRLKGNNLIAIGGKSSGYNRFIKELPEGPKTGIRRTREFATDRRGYIKKSGTGSNTNQAEVWGRYNRQTKQVTERIRIDANKKEVTFKRNNEDGFGRQDRFSDSRLQDFKSRYPNQVTITETEIIVTFAVVATFYDLLDEEEEEECNYETEEDAKAICKAKKYLKN